MTSSGETLGPEARIAALEGRLERYFDLSRILAAAAAVVIALALAAGTTAVVVLFSQRDRLTRLECRERLAGHADAAMADFLDDIARIANDDQDGALELSGDADRARSAADARQSPRPCEALRKLERIID